jgi:hypothetical protein
MNSSVPYSTLTDIADGLFARCEDDISCIAEHLDAFTPEIRDELIASDLLNAYQTFYYYFRTYPGDIAEEKLMLQPSGDVLKGIKMDVIDLYELEFLVTNNIPRISVTDGVAVLASFQGKNAYLKACSFIESELKSG